MKCISNLLLLAVFFIKVQKLLMLYYFRVNFLNRGIEKQSIKSSTLKFDLIGYHFVIFYQLL